MALSTSAFTRSVREVLLSLTGIGFRRLRGAQQFERTPPLAWTESRSLGLLTAVPSCPVLPGLASESRLDPYRNLVAHFRA